MPLPYCRIYWVSNNRLCFIPYFPTQSSVAQAEEDSSTHNPPSFLPKLNFMLLERLAWNLSFLHFGVSRLGHTQQYSDPQKKMGINAMEGMVASKRYVQILTMQPQWGLSGKQNTCRWGSWEAIRGAHPAEGGSSLNPSVLPRDTERDINPEAKSRADWWGQRWERQGPQTRDAWSSRSWERQERHSLDPRIWKRQEGPSWFYTQDHSRHCSANSVWCYWWN